MALANRVRAVSLVGHAKPRLAPPVPARSGWKEFHELAAKVGIELYPWQDTAARYLTALDAAGNPLYREVAVIVARQNGKTTLLLPLVLDRLIQGHRIIHAAQHLRVPGEFHFELANTIQRHFAEYLPARRGISWRAGQEEIRLTTGGVYQIVAASKGASRGPSNDLVIIDELREMEDNRFLAAIKPTTVAQPSGQMVYVSNAGTEASVVLNGVKARSIEDPTLAYLEWSSESKYAAGDEAGWLQANPSIGHKDGLLDNLRSEYRAARLGGTMAEFETEHLCRWVISMRPRLVHEQAWADCEGEIGNPRRSMLGVSMSPDGKRASAALAWVDGEKIDLQILFDVTGDPIDTTKLGQDILKRAMRLGVTKVGFDPITDAELAKFFKKPEPIVGRLFGNATARFVTAVESKELRWQDAAAVTEDLPWTARKAHDDTQTFEAVRADDDRPITAVLAAIRAVWLASGPRLTAPKVWVR